MVQSDLRKLLVLASGGAMLLPACSDSTPTYHQDVRPLLEARCVSCHQTGSIAPFALDTYEQAQAFAPAIVQAVTSKTMPPWSAGDADVEYTGDVRLSEAQIQTIQTWAEMGAKEGNANKPGVALPSVEPVFPGTDLMMELPVDYVPQARPDEYRCFPIRWPESQEKFVTALNVVPGNLEIVHHVAVFLLPPNDADRPFDWDAEDERPGYECFGGPSGGRAAIPVSQLGSWLPGQSGNVYPHGIGIKVQPGSTLVLQMHYNVAGSEPAPDRSRFEFHLEDQVEKEAWFGPFLDVSWVIGQMPVPANEPEVIHEIEGDPRPLFSTVAGVDLPLENGFAVHAVMFHMHNLGVRGTVTRNRRGLKSTFLNVENWDFNWQRQYALKEPFEIQDGDLLHLQCVFDNSASNQSDGKAPVDTNWGEGSADEMCVANMLISAL